MERGGHGRRLCPFPTQRNPAPSCGARTPRVWEIARYRVWCGPERVAAATSGWEVIGTDASEPMLKAAAARVVDAELGRRVVWCVRRCTSCHCRLIHSTSSSRTGYGISRDPVTNSGWRLRRPRALLEPDVRSSSSRSRGAPSGNRPSRYQESPSCSPSSPVSPSAF